MCEQQTICSKCNEESNYLPLRAFEHGDERLLCEECYNEVQDQYEEHLEYLASQD